jgi:polar amino acid transport system ATP-binding protein
MEDAHAMTPPVLSVRGLHLSRGARQILKGVDLEAAPGDIVALMGLSGSGKTTILRVVAGLEPCDKGDVACGKAGMVFQFHFLFEHLSALHNVWLAPVHVHHVPRREAEERGRKLLEQLGVGHRADALPRELSGGEAQRVAIARALAVDPPLLLLDEPTASLDPARKNDLGDVLRDLAASGRTLLMTSHDDDFVRDYATRVIVLAGGEVVEQGDPRKVLSDPQHPATQELLQVGRAGRAVKEPRLGLHSSALPKSR